MKTKKELKADYKQHKPIMGVFQVKNLINNKVLIEGSTDVHAKWNRHQTELRFGSHRKAALQKDWNRFKAENFAFEILSTLEYQEEEAINYSEEIKLLTTMILEELNFPKEQQY